MAPSVKKKHRASIKSENTSTCTDGVQKDKQAVKVKSVKKTSQTKRTKGLRIDSVSKVSFSSNTERKSEHFPMDENSKTTQKQTEERKTSQTCQVICSGSKWGKCKRMVFVNEFPENLVHFKNDNKENAVPSMNCLQTRSCTEKKISIQQHSLNSNAKKQSCGKKDTVGHCPAAVSRVGNPFRKLIFQENPVARIEGDVYEFNDENVTTKPRHTKGKRKKMLNLSDAEYIPPKSRRICKAYESVHTNTTNETNNHNIHFKRKIKNSGSKTDKSPLSEVFPKLINGSIKQAVLYDLDADNSTGSSLQVSTCEQSTEQTVANSNEVNCMSGDLNGMCHTFHFSDMKNTSVNDEMQYLKPVGLKRLPFSAGNDDNTSSGEVILSKHITVLNTSNKENISPLHPSISKTWRPTVYVSPKAYVERNCSIEDSFISRFRPLTETAIANMCKAEDSSNDFKGFTLSKRVRIPDSKFWDSHSSCCSLEMCSSEKKKTLESKDIVGKSGLKILNAASVRKMNVCDKNPILKKTNIVSGSYYGHAAGCSKVSKSLVQSDSLSMKEKRGASHKGSFTYVKKMYDGGDVKLHLKPVVCLERLVQPFFTCSNDCTSATGTTPRNITVLDTSNRENIPTSMCHSMSKTGRKSRKSWRPVAYVSPKAYVEKNDSFEDTFDSPFRTMTENGADLRNNECSSLLKCVPIQDSKFCGTHTLVCSAEDVDSSKLSKYAMDLNILSTCQKTDGISISNIHLECAKTPNQLLACKKRDACVTPSDVGNSTGISDQFLKGGRVSALHNISVGNSDSASSSVTVSVSSSKDINSETMLSKTDSISVSSSRDVSFVTKDCPRIEVRVSRGMCQNSVDRLGECNTDNYFGFDQEEPEEVLLSPIKLLACAQQPQLNIVTSSTPDHGTSFAQQCVKPWRAAFDRVSARSCKQVQSTLHSFLSKSAPQLKRDVGAVTMPEETVTNISLHHPTSCAREVPEAVSTPVIFSVDNELLGLRDQEWSSSRQPERKVYSHPRRARKWKLDSLQEEQVTQVIEDAGENISRKTAKKRSKKQDETERDMKKFLSAINNEFETIENFELCVE